MRTDFDLSDIDFQDKRRFEGEAAFSLENRHAQTKQHMAIVLAVKELGGW